MVRKREKPNKWKVNLSPKIRKTGKRMNLKGWRNERCNFNMLNVRGLRKMPTMASKRHMKMWDWKSGLKIPI